MMTAITSCKERDIYYVTSCLSPVGRLTLASDGENLTGLWIEGQKYFAGTMKGKPVKRGELPVFAVIKGWLDRYFKREKPDIAELPLRPCGGEFRQSVWGILRRIPYGEVITYGEIAKQIAAEKNQKSMSAQAVGGAVGHNPISIIIPCHRVVGVDGGLTGYAGGIGIKIKLLEIEGVEVRGGKVRGGRL